MMRLALFSLLLATSSTACVGDIIGGDSTDPNDPNDPNDPPVEPTTEVKVVVHDRMAPVGQMPVIFQAADDSVIKETTTGADGSAVADMPNGGSVTIVRLKPDDQNGNPQPPEVFTYVGVKAGDVLDLKSPSGVSIAPQTITVKVPLNENGAAQVMTPCGTGAGAPPDIQVTLDDGCTLGSEIGFFVTDLATTSFFKKAPVATTVDFSTETYRDQLASQVTATNIPGDAQVSLEKHLESAGYRFFSSPAAPGPTAEITTPDVPGAEQLITVTLTSPTGTQTLAKHEPFAAAPSSLDVTADMIAYTSAAAMDPTTGAITWTETGPGTPDFVYATVAIAREGMAFTRMIAAPHAGPSLTMPKLPAMFDTYNYLAGDQASVAHSLGKFSTGYDSLRAGIFNGVASAAPMGSHGALSYAAGQAVDPGK